MNALRGTNHRVLFQNADGNINMGLFFNNPEIEMYDIYWLNRLAVEMERSLNKKEGLILVDEWTKTKSCYVELHRISTMKSFYK